MSRQWFQIRVSNSKSLLANILLANISVFPKALQTYHNITISTLNDYSRKMQLILLDSNHYMGIFLLKLVYAILSGFYNLRPCSKIDWKSKLRFIRTRTT